MEITAVKQKLRLQEWAGQVQAQQASGMTVQQWCREQGVSPKTFYYRLKKSIETSDRGGSVSFCFYSGIALFFQLFHDIIREEGM